MCCKGQGAVCAPPHPHPLQSACCLCPQLSYCLTQGHPGPAQDLLDKARFTLRLEDQPKADVLGVHEAEVSGSDMHETQGSQLPLSPLLLVDTGSVGAWGRDEGVGLLQQVWVDVHSREEYGKVLPARASLFSCPDSQPTDPGPGLGASSVSRGHG